MERWQATVLILEQGMVIGLLLWAGVKFGQWSTSRQRLTDSTNALVGELQKHRPATSMDAANFVATFVHDDRKEAS